MRTLMHRLCRLALSAVAVVSFQLALTGSARADSQTLLNDVFGMYTNTTDPQLLESQQRGGISFGSIYVRNRIVRPNLINFDPPRLQGGCQGMDLYGGSFSFINADQLISALRAIAGNALTYAFTLALGGVCPECMQQIEWLRDKVEQVNKMMQDSCTAAQALVNATPLNEWHDNQVAAANKKQVLLGVQEDINAAFRTVESLMQKDQATGQLTPENAIWKAMDRSALGAWFGSYGDTELKEVLMSLTGTALKTAVNNAGVACTTPPPNSVPEYCISERHPIINMKTFIEGSRSGPIDLYYCADSPVNCLDVQIRQVAWVGLKERVREILFGPGPGYSGGIITKMREPGGAPYTAREQAFMTSAPMPIMTLLRESAHDAGTLVSVGEHIQEMVSSQIARNLVMEMVGAVTKSFQSATRSSELQMSAQMREKLKAVVDDTNNTEREDNQRLDAMLKMLELVAETSRRGARKDAMGLSPDVTVPSRK